MNCTYTPPAGQDITPYMTRLLAIITQLNSERNKETAMKRLQLLIDDVTTVINSKK
jgi:hypothetical protein